PLTEQSKTPRRATGRLILCGYLRQRLYPGGCVGVAIDWTGTRDSRHVCRLEQPGMLSRRCAARRARRKNTHRGGASKHCLSILPERDRHRDRTANVLTIHKSDSDARSYFLL